MCYHVVVEIARGLCIRLSTLMSWFGPMLKCVFIIFFLSSFYDTSTKFFVCAIILVAALLSGGLFMLVVAQKVS